MNIHRVWWMVHEDAPLNEKFFREVERANDWLDQVHIAMELLGVSRKDKEGRDRTGVEELEVE